jgi:SAM-dependent methyltransferase
MNYNRIYNYRFKDIKQEQRQKVWSEITRFIEDKLNHPEVLLDPAAGRCEFVNESVASERWAVEQSNQLCAFAADNIYVVENNIFHVDLPKGYFDGIFVSNFLEHLGTPHDIATFLEKMYDALRPGGRIAVIGPNFKLCSAVYFDCADHVLALTETSVAEHVYGAGFEIQEVRKAFLPFSFRGRLPPSKRLAKFYLQCPFLWPFLGKQFLIIGEKPMGLSEC